MWICLMIYDLDLVMVMVMVLLLRVKVGRTYEYDCSPSLYTEYQYSHNVTIEKHPTCLDENLLWNDRSVHTCISKPGQLKW